MSLDVPVYDPQKRQAQPKPAKGTQRKAKRKAQRTDAQKLAEFRSNVWDREVAKVENIHPESQNIARCQGCGRWLFRDVDPESTRAGQVHHRIGRRAKATRYDPNNGVLLCGPFLSNCHEKAQRGQIEV